MVLALNPDKDGRPGPAQAAGVLAGQRITRVNGIDVVDKDEIKAALRYSKEEIDFWVKPREWEASVPNSETLEHTTYTVVAAVKGIKPNSTTVLRRYSDFNKMHRDLSAGSKVPFPPKKWWGHTAPEFVESRRQALDDYLRNVVQYFGDSPVLEKFLRGVNAAESNVANSAGASSGSTNATADSVPPILTPAMSAPDPEPTLESKSSKNVKSQASTSGKNIRLNPNTSVGSQLLWMDD
eukprot:SAG31_NODE_506_length_14749_cov_8.119181_9_plen_238_part_00